MEKPVTSRPHRKRSVPGDAVFTTELHGGTTVSRGAATIRAPPAGAFRRVRRESEKTVGLAGTSGVRIVNVAQASWRLASYVVDSTRDLTIAALIVVPPW